MEQRWVGKAAMLIAVQLCFCSSIALAFGFRQMPPFAKYANISLGLVAIVIAVRVLWNLRHRPAQPGRYLASCDWTSEKGFVVAMGLLWLQFVCLTWAKAMLPLVGLWADVPLANLEATIFGQDAWRYLPPPARWLDAIYLLWLPTVGVTYTILYFSKRANRDTALVALFITIGALGTVGQYALPSGGPIFFERLGLGDRFADMVPMFGSHQVAGKLWAAYEGHYIAFATGISAFPSIHVATSAWIALTFRNWLAYAYLAVIFLGSIVLGWHYALDGIAGIFGAVLCYGLAQLKFELSATELAR